MRDRPVAGRSPVHSHVDAVNQSNGGCFPPRAAAAAASVSQCRGSRGVWGCGRGVWGRPVGVRPPCGRPVTVRACGLTTDR